MTPPGPCRPVPGMPWPRRVPSAPGRGAPAQTLRCSCDQSVIDGQGTLLEIDLVSLPAALTLELELALMAWINDRLETREDPAVPSGELARVQDRRGDLPLGDPDLDTPASEYRDKRIVICDRP